MSLDKPSAHMSLFRLKTLPFWTYLFIIVTYFYSDLPIYHGHIGYDPDIYLRATQIMELLRHGEWFNTLINRIDPPGIDVYSRLGDLPYLLLAYPLHFVLEERTAVEVAVSLAPPFFLLPLYLWLSVWVSRPFLGPKWSLLAPIPAVFCAQTIIYFGPGQCDHHNLQILLFACLFGLFNRILNPAYEKQSLKHGFMMACAAAASLSLSIEGLPFLVYLLCMAGLYTLFTHPKNIAHFWAMFGWSFPILTALLLIATRSPDTYFDNVLYRVSWLSVLIATSCGAVALALSYATLRPLHWLGRWGVVLGATALTASTAITLAPDLLDHGLWSGIPDEIRKWALSNTNELQPLKNISPTESVIFGFFLPLCLGAYGYLETQTLKDGTTWSRYSNFLLLAIILFVSVFFIGRMGRVTAVLYAPALLLCAKHIYHKARGFDTERGRVMTEVLAFSLLFILCGPLLSNVIQNKKALDSLFYYPPRFAKGENTLNLGTYLNMGELGHSQKRILAGLNYGTELAFRSNHIFLGTGQQYTTASGLNVLKEFYAATTDRQAAKILADHKVDYIVYSEGEMDGFRKIINIPEDNAIAVESRSACKQKKSPTPDMLSRLKYGDYPDFIKQIELPFGGLTFLQIDKQRLDTAPNNVQ